MADDDAPAADEPTTDGVPVDGESPGPAPRAVWLLPARNLLFLLLVLGHGVRRLLPPW